MKKTLLVLLSFIIFSCNNEDDIEDDKEQITDKTEMMLVTGINLLPGSGPSPLRLGNPNIFIDKSMLTIFPNPVVKVLNMESREVITDVWLIKATPEKIYQDVNFGTILNSSTYTETEVSTASLLKVNDNETKNVYLNLENLEKGYYRIFIRTNGILMWDNLLYLDNEKIQEIVDYWE